MFAAGIRMRKSANIAPLFTSVTRACRCGKSARHVHKSNLCDTLLTFASNLGIPVHKRAIGIVAPCPDVQFEEGGQAIPVRTGDELKRLAFQHRWGIVPRR